MNRDKWLAALMIGVIAWGIISCSRVVYGAEHEPGYIEARRCVFIESGYNSFTNEFEVVATTPIQLFTVTKSSGRTSKPVVKNNKVTFTMEVQDPKNFFVEYTLVDQCDTWKSSMRTAKP